MDEERRRCFRRHMPVIGEQLDELRRRIFAQQPETCAFMSVLVREIGRCIDQDGEIGTTTNSLDGIRGLRISVIKMGRGS